MGQSIDSLKREIANLRHMARLEKEKEKAKREYYNLRKKKRDLKLRKVKSAINSSKRIYGKARKTLTPYIRRGNSIFGLNNVGGFKI